MPRNGCRMHVGDRCDVRRSPYAKACGDFLLRCANRAATTWCSADAADVMRIRCCGPLVWMAGSSSCRPRPCIAARRARHERSDRSCRDHRPGGCRVRRDRTASRRNAAGAASVRLGARRRAETAQRHRPAGDGRCIAGRSGAACADARLARCVGAAGGHGAHARAGRDGRRARRRGSVASSGPARAAVRRVAAPRSARGHRRAAMRRSRSGDSVDDGAAA